MATMPTRSRSPAGTTAHQSAFEDLGTPLFDTTFVVVDLETTGLSPTRDRITEVGAVKARGGEVLGELRTFVHPGRPIPAAITALTGIDDHTVRDAPRIGTVLPTLQQFLAGGVFVAHNAPFDLGFLREALARAGHDGLDPPVIDTARLARRVLRGEVRSFRLAVVAQHLRVRTAPAHRALADARATLDVLHGLIERAGRLGATTLEDLQELTRSRSDPAFRRRGLVADAPRAPGVYRFVDVHGEILYLGKATDLRARLRTYFGQDPRRHTADLLRATTDVRWTTTATLLEAEVRELRGLHAHRPRYNRRSLQPTPTVFLAFTREPFPRLSVVRTDAGARWTFGPLAGRRQAELVSDVLADATGLRTCTTRLRRAQDHAACLLKDLGRCHAPCDGSSDPTAHAEVVARTRSTIEDPTVLLDLLRSRMGEAAARGRYERAGELRHQLHAVARALADTRARQALRAAGRLVVTREVGDQVEVVVLDAGRLVGSAALPAGSSDADAQEAADRLDATVATEAEASPDAEELALVLAWLRRPAIRLVTAGAGLAWPCPGGAALHATVEEAGLVARELRRDRQRLAGDKVRQRSAAPSDDDAHAPGPRPRPAAPAT